MSRITHKEIEYKNLIEDPVQKRVYEWLKQYKNVWFSDLPNYSREEGNGLKHYMMFDEMIGSVKCDDYYVYTQEMFNNITKIIENNIIECDKNNNTLMIYLGPDGLWRKRLFLEPNSSELNFDCYIAWASIPRINGGVNIDEFKPKSSINNRYRVEGDDFDKYKFLLLK